MQFPITIGLHRSRFMDAALFLAVVAANATVLAWPQPVSFRLAVIISVGLIAVIAWRRLAPPFSAIRIERGGQVSVLRRGNLEFSSVELLPGATVHPCLTIVRLKMEDNREQWLIATVDSLKTEDFRRLRIFLRWRAKFSGLADGA